jgi:hypothetical protein
MSVCVYSVLILSCVCRYRPCDGMIPGPRSPTDCVKDQELKSGQGPTKGL